MQEPGWDKVGLHMWGQPAGRMPRQSKESVSTERRPGFRVCRKGKESFHLTGSQHGESEPTSEEKGMEVTEHVVVQRGEAERTRGGRDAHTASNYRLKKNNTC